MGSPATWAESGKAGARTRKVESQLRHCWVSTPGLRLHNEGKTQITKTDRISNIYRYLRVDSIHFGKSAVKLLLRVVFTDATQESCVNGGVASAVAGPVSDAEVSQDRGPPPPGQTPRQRPRARL